MKTKLVTLLTTLMLNICAFAQTGSGELDPFLKQFGNKRVLLNYEYVISGPTEITVRGNAIVQKSCFRMEGAGLLIMCDGESIWTLDWNGKEAYVEKAGPMDYVKYLRDVEYDNGKIEGTYVEPMSGAIIPFSISDLQFLPISGDLSPFSPEEDMFESGDWIITDLR